MERRGWNLLLDWTLLVGALATFTTGLVLLVGLHMGRGAFAASALGVGKLVWLNIHRLSAVLVVAGVGTHAALHWRAFRGVLVGRTTRIISSERILYAAFLVAAVSGLIAWLVLEGSSPLLGPALTGRASGARHHWIDTHHIASLVSLGFVVHHVGHRGRFLVRGIGRLLSPGSPARRASAAERATPASRGSTPRGG